MTQSRVLIPLTFLATVLVGGCIAQVLIETARGVDATVNPVLAALAGSAVSALFGQFAFLGHTTAAAAQRSDYLTSLDATLATVSGPTGRATGAPPAAAPPQPPATGQMTTQASGRL